MSGTGAARTVPYQYVVLRCVPRADREEFVNVGVVLYCEAAGFLEATWSVDRERLHALDPGIDVDRVCAGLDAVAAVCRGDGPPGTPAAGPPGRRFGFVSAPRSTVVRPGPVHGGMTADPARTLDHLVHRLVG